MKLLVVRHGETVQNSKNIIQGQQPGDLSPVGLIQSDLLAEKLSLLSFDHVFCSDLKRTRDTLQPLIPHLKSHNVPITYTEMIRERAFGVLEGKPGKDYIRAMKESGINRYEYRPEEGENFPDLQKRTDSFLDELITDHLGKNILVMSHGGTIRTIITRLLNATLEEHLLREIKNTSISSFELCADKTTTEDIHILNHSINDHQHLSKMASSSDTSLGVDFNA